MGQKLENIRPMGAYENNYKSVIDQANLAELDQRIEFYREQLKLSPIEAQQRAWEDMEEQFSSSANSLPAKPVSNIDEICPRE